MQFEELFVEVVHVVEIRLFSLSFVATRTASFLVNFLSRFDIVELCLTQTLLNFRSSGNSTPLGFFGSSHRPEEGQNPLPIFSAILN